jgi:hypothetical protein
MIKFSNGITDSVIPIVQEPAKLMIGEESIDRYFYNWQNDDSVIREILITTKEVDSQDAKDGMNWFKLMELGTRFLVGYHGRKDEFVLIPYRDVTMALIRVDYMGDDVKILITPNGKECHLEE